MQVFLPYSSFEESVHCLDPKRLGNQVYRECLTLIRGGWPHHPVSRMWALYPHALAQYALAGLEELKKRGYYYPHHFQTFNSFLQNSHNNGLPSFIGNEEFHKSHRAALLFKNYNYYKQFKWNEKPELNYFWPHEY